MRPFFERLIARMKQNPQDYPIWVGELYAEFHRGTLTSVAKNNRNNRLAEIALREIEMLAVMALQQPVTPILPRKSVTSGMCDAEPVPRYPAWLIDRCCLR